jgi:iron complex outermembrane receptor protein
MGFKDRPFTIAGLTSYNTAIQVSGCNAAGAAFIQPYVAPGYGCFIPTGTATVDNLSRGVDLEINWLPTAADRLDLTVESLKSTYKGAPKVPVFTATQLAAAAVANGGVSNTTLAQSLIDAYNATIPAFDGSQLQNAPKLAINMSYQHRFVLPGGSSLSPSVNGAYKSKYWVQGGVGGITGFTGATDIRTFLNPGHLYRQDGATIWNAYATWESANGKFSVNGFIRNLQNKPIMTNIGGEPGATGIAYLSLDAPRTFGMTFSANM